MTSPTGSRWGDLGALRPHAFDHRSRVAEVPWSLDRVHEVPDTVLEAGRAGDLEVRAASTRGSAHRVDGQVRQDAVGVTALDDGYVIAAVADGVGAAANSHWGAHLAVRHALGFLTWALPDSTLSKVDLVGALRAAGQAVAGAGARPADRCTTLTVAVVSVDRTAQGYRFALARVGDTPAFALGDGRFTPLFGAPATYPEPVMHGRPAVHSQPAGDSLPAPRGPIQHRCGHLRPGDALVLATDGLGIPVLDTEAGGYLAAAWADPPGPLAFLQQLQFQLKSYDDDRSAVGVWAPR